MEPKKAKRTKEKEKNAVGSSRQRSTGPRTKRWGGCCVIVLQLTARTNFRTSMTIGKTASRLKSRRRGNLGPPKNSANATAKTSQGAKRIPCGALRIKKREEKGEEGKRHHGPTSVSYRVGVVNQKTAANGKKVLHRHVLARCALRYQKEGRRGDGRKMAASTNCRRRRFG